MVTEKKELKICSDPSRPKLTIRPRKTFGWSALIASTTDEPHIISTTPGPLDDLEFEHNLFQGRISDEEVLTIKEQIRKIRGFTSANLDTIPPPEERKKIDYIRPPKVDIRHTTTSSLRQDVMRHKMIVRCTGFIKMIENYNKVVESNDLKLFTDLRNEIMNKSMDQLEAEFELQELYNLKVLAEQATVEESLGARDNTVSVMRLKVNKGEPIITTMFRKNYYRYKKAPYIISNKKIQPDNKFLPKIDKSKETWLIPIDNENDSLKPVNLPLEKQNSRKKYVPGGPSKRQLARPPIRKKRPLKNNTAAEWQENQVSTGSSASASPTSGFKKKKKSRPPWRFS